MGQISLAVLPRYVHLDSQAKGGLFYFTWITRLLSIAMSAKERSSSGSNMCCVGTVNSPQRRKLKESKVNNMQPIICRVLS